MACRTGFSSKPRLADKRASRFWVRSTAWVLICFFSQSIALAVTSQIESPTHRQIHLIKPKVDGQAISV
ncbi:MAG: hypothetical protein AAGD07_20740, partial [Planctomycetota bacterium]